MHDNQVKFLVHTSLSTENSTINIEYILKSLPHKEYIINDHLVMYAGLRTISSTFTGRLILFFEVYNIDFDEALKEVDTAADIGKILVNLEHFVNDVNSLNISVPCVSRDKYCYVDGRYLFAPIFDYKLNTAIDPPDMYNMTFSITEADFDKATIIERIQQALKS